MPKKIKVKNYRHSLQFCFIKTTQVLLISASVAGEPNYIICLPNSCEILKHLEEFIIRAADYNKKNIKLSFMGYTNEMYFYESRLENFNIKPHFPFLWTLHLPLNNINLNDFYTEIHNLRTQIEINKHFFISAYVNFDSSLKTCVEIKNI